MTDDLIDRIYECAVVPEMWPGLLDDLAEMTGAQGGILFSARSSLTWTASDSLSDVFAEYVEDGWFERCSRRLCLMTQTQPSFFVEQDFWTSRQLDMDPIYRDFFRPHGLGWSAGTGLKLPTGDNIVFSIERRFDQGPVERPHVDMLNALRPHLARSALVTARLGLQRAKGSSDALIALKVPALLLDAGGKVVEANDLVEDLSDLMRWAAQARPVLSDTRANRMLTDAIQTLGAPSGQAVRSIPVRNAEGDAAAVAHLMPIKRSAQDIFGQSYALLLLTPVSSKRAPSVDLMRSLFDLTPSEARVASGVATGQTLKQIASAGNVTLETVRTHLRRVFEKTGCSRQAEVATMLANVTLGGEGALA